MFKQLASAIVLSCACTTALADHGFEPIAALAPPSAQARAIAVGDVTGDGRDDVLVLAGGTHFFYRNRVILYAQTASGFAPAVAIDYHPERTDYSASGTGIELFDLDGDGSLEIIVSHGHYPRAGLTVLRAEGDGYTARTLQTVEALQTMRFMDVDGDGHVDLVGQDNYGGVAILPGDGSAGFDEASWFPYGAYPSPIQLVDMDGDGRKDLVYQQWDELQLRLHEGAGFSETPQRLIKSNFSSRTLVADFTGDQRPDLAVSSYSYMSDQLLLYPQERDGTYRRKVPLRGAQRYVHSLHAADLNGDGRTDLMSLSGSYPGGLSVRLGNDQGGLSPAVTHDTGEASTVVIGDVNHDGITDLVLLDGYQGVSYMLGRNSALGPDLAAFIGLNANAAAVRIENTGSASAGSFLFVLTVKPRLGSANAIGVPDGCYAGTWDGSLRVTCQMPALAPGGHHERVFTYGIAGVTGETFLTGLVRVDTPWPELRKDNNVASKRIFVSVPAPKAANRLSAPGLRAPAR